MVMQVCRLGQGRQVCHDVEMDGGRGGWRGGGSVWLLLVLVVERLDERT